MALINAICPECGGEIQVDNAHSNGICPYCGKVFNINDAARKYSAIQSAGARGGALSPAMPMASSSMISARNYAWQNMIPMYYCESQDANQAYLRGISFLAYGDCRSAAGCFLDAAKLSPTTAHFWLYLLYSVTERYTDIEVIAHIDESRFAGDKKIIVHNVYRNFVGTARPEDYSFSLRELGLDIRPERLWSRIISDIATMPIRLTSAAEETATIEYAYERLTETGADLSENLKQLVSGRVNPVREGCMEINSMLFFAVPADGYFKLPSDVQSVEFMADNVPGSERFTAFKLTSNVKHIGSNFPFKEIIVGSDVVKIPADLVCGASKLERVRLSRSVSSIGAGAFADCVNLTKVDFKEGLKKIGSKAFFNTGIRSAILPSSLSDIGDEAFSMNREDSLELDLSKVLFVVNPEVPSCGKRYWNRIGNHRFGYLIRKKYALSIVYPVKARLTSKGKLRPDVLTEEEKRVFKELACNYASIMTGGEVTTVDEPFGEKIRNMLGK